MYEAQILSIKKNVWLRNPEKVHIGKGSRFCYMRVENVPGLKSVVSSESIICGSGNPEKVEIACILCQNQTNGDKQTMDVYSVTSNTEKVGLVCSITLK